MKNIFLMLFLNLMVIHLNSQTILFNNWVESGKDKPFDWAEPEESITSNGLYEFIGKGITKSEEGALLKTLNVFGKAKASEMSIGNGFIDYVNQKIISTSIFTELPIKELEVYYDFSNDKSNDDYGKVVITIMEDNKKFRLEETLESGKDRIKTILIPININSDSLTILFSSTDEEFSKEGGELLIKKLNIIPRTSAVNENLESIKIYPNPVKAGQKLNIKNNDSYIIKKLVSTNGKVKLLNSEGIIPDETIPGLYILRLIDNIGYSKTVKIEVY